MKLCIVESPGKVKTIQKFLGSDYIVHATVGHVYCIDPKDDAIDIDNNYEPRYIAIPKKVKVISEIKALAKKCDEIYIATDNDREGENIGYSVAKFALKTLNVKRATFQEITKSAILNAINNPKKIDLQLVDAQKARSVLDMLVGYKVSPVLWRKVSRGTSAGRVQSIGLRLIVERQKEIDDFKPEEYWDIIASFESQRKDIFSVTYKSNEKLISEGQVNGVLESIGKAKKWSVKSLTKTRKSRSSNPVFNTSSLQQFCSSSFGWDGKKTMKLAQALYEGFAVAGHDATGLITYHRTDSLNVSTEAVDNLRSFIKDSVGDKYLSESVRVFKSKKTAQEAHEGIRPSHLEFSLNDVRRAMPDDEYKLYEAIYYRFVACQMADAQFDHTKIVIESDNNHEFVANGQVLVFDGFLKFWPYSTTKEEVLPVLNENENMLLKEAKGNQHFTKAPASYNTASLVKMLEEQGIGRPSTYATIVDTLIKRQYMEKSGKAFVPTELGKRISQFLVVAFPELMNLNYTARIEQQLDEIAEEGKVWHTVVDGFYKELSKRLVESKDVKGVKGEATEIACPKCKVNKLIVRFGKFGKFYGCTGYMIKGDGHCDAIFKIGESGEPVEKVKKEVRYLEGVVCDKCGSKIVIRTGHKSGKEFCGCAAFPKCHRMFSLDGKPFEFKNKRFKKKNK